MIDKLFYLDGISIWFIAIISLLFALGLTYGTDDIKHYKEHRRAVRWHWIMYFVAFASMLALFGVKHSLLFLVCWEFMALSSFFLIIFESWKKDVIKAGMNFFIQSHISVLFLTAGFIAMADLTGTYNFDAWMMYEGDSTLPFILCCIGFAIKAGFVPFHTWLPLAHPAAPAHISGVMSAVIIKMGIYGIIRSIFWFNTNLLTAGYIILGISAISGVYGVLLAIAQHNLKKLLAYHSIENIGIIGLGIGIGCLGLGLQSDALASIGFIGALMHTLGHALFKSNLFFAAGNVYHATHTLNIERLGGLLKKMPLTGLAVLLSSIAICGLPPMNGFISEFIIYTGLFGFMYIPKAAFTIFGAILIIALVMIGGLAIMCFAKAFSIVFLGTPREDLPEEPKEFGGLRTVPMIISVAIMAFIGLAPRIVTNLACEALDTLGIDPGHIAENTKQLGNAAIVFVAICLITFLVRALINRKKKVEVGETWGCGYTAPTPKIQYTATSFVKTLVKLFGVVFGFRKEKDAIKETYPQTPIRYSSENYDKIESALIEKPVKGYMKFTSLFAFLENGKIQSYILYGIIFIVAVCLIALILC